MTAMHFAAVDLQIFDSNATVLAHYYAIFFDLHFEVSFLDTIETERSAILTWLGCLLMNCSYP